MADMHDEISRILHEETGNVLKKKIKDDIEVMMSNEDWSDYGYGREIDTEGNQIFLAEVYDADGNRIRQFKIEITLTEIIPMIFDSEEITDNGE